MDDKNKDPLDLDLDEIFGKLDDVDFALVPFEDDDSNDKTKKTCMHLKKRKVKFQTFEYWYCPSCRREVKDKE